MLEAVIDFYDHGGTHAPNNRSRSRRSGSLRRQVCLAAFLRRPLTTAASPRNRRPLDRPTQSRIGPRRDALRRARPPGTNGIPPQILAAEPAYLGNPAWTIAMDRGKAASRCS